MATNRIQYVFDLLAGKNTLSPEFKKFQDSAKDIQGNLNNIAKTSAVVFAGISAAIGGAVKAASGFEDIGVQFEVLTGNVQTAQTALENLKQFSSKTPFEFGDVADAGKKLLAFGYDVNQLKPLLREIGDVAAASGKPIGDLSLIFGQVAAAGKLTGQRLQQFQEAAVPIGPAIAKVLGVSENAVANLVSSGRVNLQVFEKAFASLSEKGGFAFGGMNKLSETLSGKISTLKDNFNQLAGKVGDYFLPIFKLAVDKLNDFLVSTGENKGLTDLISKFLSFGAVAAGVVTAIASLASAIIGLGVAFKAVALAADFAGISFQKAFIASGIGLAVVALTALITDLYLNWETRTKQIGELWDSLKTKLSDGVDKVKGFFTGIFSDEVKKPEIEVKTNLPEVKKEAEETSKKIAEPVHKIIKVTVDENSFGNQIKKIGDDLQKNFKKGGFTGAAKGLGSDLIIVAKNFGKDLQDKIDNADFTKVFEEIGPQFVNGLKAGEDGAKKFISGISTSVATAVLGPAGAAVGPILDLLMMSGDQLRATITSFLQAIPKIVEQIINNLPVIQQAIIANMPGLIEAFTRLFVIYMSDPKIWTQIALASITALIQAIPLAVKAYIDGLKSGLKDGIISSFTEAFDKLRDLFRKIFSFDGGGRGPVESFLGFDFPFIKFAKGGKVKGRAKFPGNNEGNDTVPALLSPGEIVIPRTVALGSEAGIVGFLKSIGSLSPSRDTFNKIPVHRAFGSFFGGTIGGILNTAAGVASGAIGGITDILGNVISGNISSIEINKLVNTATNSLFDLTSQLGLEDVSKLLAKLGFNQIEQFRELIKSLLNLGITPDISSLIKDPFNYIGNLVKNNIGIFKKQFQSLLHPLATGGELLGSGVGDSLPALLAPKELVVDRSTTKQLKDFLNQDSSTALTEIKAILERPITVTTKAEVNGQAFADIILQLNRRNARLAI